MKEKKIEILTINLQIKDTTLTLSLDDAKKLHETLGELFKKEIIWNAPTKIIERHIERPWWHQPYQPAYLGDDLKIWCSGSASNSIACDSSFQAKT